MDASLSGSGRALPLRGDGADAGGRRSDRRRPGTPIRGMVGGAAGVVWHAACGHGRLGACAMDRPLARSGRAAEPRSGDGAGEGAGVAGRSIHRPPAGTPDCCVDVGSYVRRGAGCRAPVTGLPGRGHDGGGGAARTGPGCPLPRSGGEPLVPDTRRPPARSHLLRSQASVRGCCGLRWGLCGRVVAAGGGESRWGASSRSRDVIPSQHRFGWEPGRSPRRFGAGADCAAGRGNRFLGTADGAAFAIKSPRRYVIPCGSGRSEAGCRGYHERGGNLPAGGPSRCAGCHSLAGIGRYSPGCGR